MFPEIMVIPMREELTRLGVQELRTAEEVDRALAGESGTAMVVVNSICGCAAGRMRPAVRAALQHPSHPEKVFTVFAGQDADAKAFATATLPTPSTSFSGAMASKTSNLLVAAACSSM